MGDPPFQTLSCDRSRLGADDDVRSERELGVDARLLVVRGAEETEVDTEGEQEADDEEAAVDRWAAAAGACEQKAGPGGRAAAGGSGTETGEGPPTQAEEELGRTQPEQGGREEHVHRQRQRGVRVRVDDSREAGTGGQPVDEARDGERDQVEIEALPERP